MAPGDNKIGLAAVFEDADFQKGIAEYNSAISQSSSATDEGASSMSSAWAGLSTVGAAAWAGIAVGVAAVTAELYLAIDAAMQTEDIMAAMEFQIGKTGDKTGITADQVNGLASSLSKVLPIDDEVITQAITMGMRFDGVTKDNIEPMIRAAADLATSTGKTLPAAMKELALAVSDPDKAMRLLKDANITLSDAEMATLKGFKDTGDAAGATAFLIGRVNEKIGGLAETMGQTASGKMKIMQTAFGNMQETLGGPLLDSLKSVFDKITEFANDPRTLAFIADLGSQIGTMASSVVDSLPDIMAVIEGVVTWFQDNQPVIVGILAAVGVALVAFGVSAAAAGIAAVAPFLPVIAILGAVGVAAAILTKAWNEDWGGMQGKFAKAWDRIRPVFDKLQKWLGETLPKAIDLLSDYWENILLPAIQTVVEWVVDNVLPLLVELVEWLGENVPKAIKILGDYWEKVLLPAIRTVIDWINQNVIPLFESLVNWLSENIPAAIQTLSDYWNNVLLPAIQAVYDFFNNSIIPIFNAVVALISGAVTTALNNLTIIWNSVLLPAITAVYNFVNDFVIPLLNAVSNLITAVLNVALNALAGLWQNVLLPAIQGVYNFINNFLSPIFNSISTLMSGALTTALNNLSTLWNLTLLPAITAVYNFINTYLKPIFDTVATTVSGTLTTALTNLTNFFNNTFSGAIGGIQTAFQFVIDTINTLTDLLNNLNLPDWLTPGSPTPLEMGLRGINEQLDKMAQASIPAIRHQMEIMTTPRDVIGGSGQRFIGGSISNSSQRTNNYLYGAQFNVDSQGGLIEILQGLQ